MRRRERSRPADGSREAAVPDEKSRIEHTDGADVLVVEDDADVRRSTSEILRASGFSVTEADDGEVARGLLRAHRYRMVLLDVRMPRLDGVSLMEAVEDMPPVVVHSAYTLTSGEQRRLGVKVAGYLHKPVSPEQLVRAVRAVIGPAPEG